MTNKVASSPEIYKSLVSLMLPEGVLDYFDLTNFTVLDDSGNGYLSKEVIHLFLHEKDNRTEEQKASSVPNGFAEDRKILDFPICGKRTVLHIFRRRWLDVEKKSFKTDLQGKDEVEFPGTRYSKEFALFLKVATGERADDGDFHWPDLYD